MEVCTSYRSLECLAGKYQDVNLVEFGSIFGTVVTVGGLPHENLPYRLLKWVDPIAKAAKAVYNEEIGQDFTCIHFRIGNEKDTAYFGKKTRNAQLLSQWIEKSNLNTNVFFILSDQPEWVREMYLCGSVPDSMCVVSNAIQPIAERFGITEPFRLAVLEQAVSRRLRCIFYSSISVQSQDKAENAHSASCSSTIV